METHCYTVFGPDGTEAYVAAKSEADALNQLPGARAERTFPWVADYVVDEDTEVVEGGDTSGDHNPGKAHPRTAEVRDWVKSYVGRNQFALDVQFRLTAVVGGGVTRKPARLTWKMVEALGIVKDREAAWAKADAERAAKPESGLDIRSAVPAGTWRAAAEAEDGTLAFVRIDVVDKGKWAGWVFVRAHLGGDEGKRLGSQRPDANSYVGSWTTVLTNVLADFEAAVERYGNELGECGVCGRQLTNEESRQGGIGPVCREKAGWVR